MSVTGRLEGWQIDPRGIIWGHLYDDVRRRWREGQYIHTSFISNLSSLDLKEGDIVETLNSTYLLGRKDA